MNQTVWTALQFVFAAYVLLFVMGLVVAGLIVAVRRLVVVKEATAADSEKGKE